jgi:hypothetical protein
MRAKKKVAVLQESRNVGKSGPLAQLCTSTSSAWDGLCSEGTGLGRIIQVGREVAGSAGLFSKKDDKFPH